jgi:hypothetical protein
VDQGLVNGSFVWRERWPNQKCLRSPKKHLFAVWILRCISRLTSFVGVIKDPRYTNSLMTSNCLSPIATLCPTSRIVLSFRAAIIYFHICSFFLTLIWLLLFAMPSEHPKGLTDSYLISSAYASSCVSFLKIVPVICRFACRTITSSTTLKSSSANQFQLHHISNRLDVMVAPIWSLGSSAL